MKSYCIYCGDETTIDLGSYQNGRLFCSREHKALHYRLNQPGYVNVFLNLHGINFTDFTKGLNEYVVTKSNLYRVVANGISTNKTMGLSSIDLAIRMGAVIHDFNKDMWVHNDHYFDYRLCLSPAEHGSWEKDYKVKRRVNMLSTILSEHGVLLKDLYSISNNVLNKALKELYEVYRADQRHIDDPLAMELLSSYRESAWRWLKKHKWKLPAKVAFHLSNELGLPIDYRQLFDPMLPEDYKKMKKQLKIIN